MILKINLLSSSETQQTIQDGNHTSGVSLESINTSRQQPKENNL